MRPQSQAFLAWACPCAARRAGGPPPVWGSSATTGYGAWAC